MTKRPKFRSFIGTILIILIALPAVIWLSRKIAAARPGAST